MIYVFLADGFEEMEALAPLDILRRAGLKVATVGVTGSFVTAAHGVAVKTDLNLNDISEDMCEGVILPGGMPGTNHLKESEKVCSFTLKAYKKGAMIAAICAAPSVLGKLGILNQKNATCFPGFESELLGATVTDDYVTVCENIITARGAGASIEFGLALVSYLLSEEKSKELRASMQCVR